MHGPASQTQRGLTLIEILLALAVAAVLLGIAAPSYSALMQRLASEAAARQLFSALTLARAQALTSRQAVIVCPGQGVCSGDGRWEVGYVVGIDANRNDRLDPGERRIWQSAAATRVTILSNTGRPQVRYLPTGRASGSNATFRVCPRLPVAGATHTLVISNTGRVRWGQSECPA
ncbi:MAG: GspH/FimT family pseudopilin [Xanthomonadales bacterium]|jgi:type IV fimbrial biogenesis protein FimT|nr:GspH/FimT family pseudopilin [Xanthomonadales bacterium]